MEDNGYIAGKSMRVGKWIIEGEELCYYSQNKLGGIFGGLGALGGLLGSTTSKEKREVVISLSSIIDVYFEKFRLNNKSIVIKTTDNQYQIIFDHPQKWIDYLRPIAQKNRDCEVK